MGAEDGGHGRRRAAPPPTTPKKAGKAEGEAPTPKRGRAKEEVKTEAKAEAPAKKKPRTTKPAPPMRLSTRGRAKAEGGAELAELPTPPPIADVVAAKRKEGTAASPQLTSMFRAAKSR